ncbi:MAG: DUF4246 family protein [Polyangiales bacterium]
MSKFAPALGPTRSFISTLVAESYDEELRIGDVVELEDESGHTPEGKVISLGAETKVRLRDGRVETLDVDAGEFYFVDRPSLRGLWETFLQRGRPEGLALQEAVDGALVAKLTAGFDALMNGRVDYHPGSGTIVRDLVHPSLYPHIDSAAQSGETPTLDLWKRPYEASKYQWLPTDFVVSEEGTVVVEGEINNLPRSENELMYAALAELFEQFVPLFESVAGYAEGLTLLDDSLEGEHELPEPPAKPVEAKVAPPQNLKGRRLQVITKIIEYKLEGDESFEGVWHVEGMSHENILATGVYTLARDENLEGGALRFKRPYTQDDAGALFWNVAQCRPKVIEEMVDEAHIPLGSMETTDQQLFVFPNCHVHKLSKMSVAGGGTARRRVVVFWLVHPDHRITGMDDVPPPQESMTFEAACVERLALMEERRLHKQSHNVRSVSLCEH